MKNLTNTITPDSTEFDIEHSKLCYKLMNLDYTFLFYIYVCIYICGSTVKNVEEILDCIANKMVENSGQRIVEGDLRIDLNILSTLRDETKALAELKY